MRLSAFGQKFTARSGILALMDDLGRALTGSEKKYMLGGGNPARISEVAKLWREQMERILSEDDRFEQMVSNYDPPQGNPAFINALAELFRREYGWDIGPGNIAVTNGSQTSFFMLFNMLGGRQNDGSRRRILLPIVPEYIGYADQTLDAEDFVSAQPRIELIGEHRFKYRVDFAELQLGEDLAAICVSRPTNPTGNVLTDEEVYHLDEIAREHDVPLILDNAYGVPFPGMIFAPATPIWNENIILAMSLSKIGLPSVRTGIIVAREEIIAALCSCNAILSLANAGVGQQLVTPLIESGEILRISSEIVRPFYESKSARALQCIDDEFGDDLAYAVHLSEGSLFLWVWFRNISITTMELYERCKARNTIVVPGRYFFFGLEEDWPHRDQCIRINYGMPDEDVRRGIRVIAEEARKAVIP